MLAETEFRSSSSGYLLFSITSGLQPLLAAAAAVLEAENLKPQLKRKS